MIILKFGCIITQNFGTKLTRLSCYHVSYNHASTVRTRGGVKWVVNTETFANMKKIRIEYRRVPMFFKVTHF